MSVDTMLAEAKRRDPLFEVRVNSDATTYIVCPRCQHIHLDTCDYPGEGWNDEVNEMECAACGHEFRVRTVFAYVVEPSGAAGGGDDAN